MQPHVPSCPPAVVWRRAVVVVVPDTVTVRVAAIMVPKRVALVMAMAKVAATTVPRRAVPITNSK